MLRQKLEASRQIIDETMRIFNAEIWKKYDI
jgi:hypothetical protein